MIRNVICLALVVTLVSLGCGGPSQQPALIPDAIKDKAVSAKDRLFQRLSERLMEVMQAEGPAKAIEVCSTEANEIAMEVGEQQHLRIGRTSSRLRNQSNVPPTWANDLLGSTPEPKFTAINESTFGALFPIKLQAKCLMCHGPKDSLAPDVNQQLAKLYPNDQATGFREGDLRGWFWVEISKNQQ